MFRKPTVIILGAGASWHYYYPTGEELIDGIISSYNTYSFNSYNELKKDLIIFSPLVIDYFLYHHKIHKDAGRKAIAFEILKSEKIIDKTSGSRIKNKDDKIVDGGNWYKYLVESITSGCEKPEDILKNKLTIINFNYDVSLEYYLYTRIAENPFFTENDRNYGEEFLKNLDIKHVYGSLYKFKWQDDNGLDINKYGKMSGGKIIRDFFNNYAAWDENMRKRLGDFVSECNELSKNIEVIGVQKTREEKKEELDPYREKIKNAQNIFILGYGFDENNSNLLFQGGRGNYNNKAIYYTNLNNSLRINSKVSKIFYKHDTESLHNRDIVGAVTDSSYKVTKSTRSVYDALKYDFDLTG